MRPALRRLPILLALLATVLVSGCVRTAGHAEWSPDAVPDAYRRSIAALMWPGATRSFQVTENGDLYNGAWYVRVSPSASGTTAAAPKRIAYEDRWCPVVRWSRVSGDVTWEFEAVALPEPEPSFLGSRGPIARYVSSWQRREDRRSSDAVLTTLATYAPNHADSLFNKVKRPLERDAADRAGLLVSLRVRAVNAKPAPVPAHVELEFAPPLEGLYRCPDSLLRTPWENGWAAATGNDSLLGWGDGVAHGSRLSLDWKLPASGSKEQTVVLPAYPMPASALRDWAAIPHDVRVAEARSFWTREVRRGARFDLPDPEVRDALRAARVVLLSLRERRGSVWAPIGGPFHYRDVWLRDGARATQALAIAGYTHESREMAGGLLEFQWPNGPFVSQTGQLDGTGQAMWAFEQVMLRPAPAPDVARYARASLRAWASIERQRSAASTVVNGYHAGLLPPTQPNDNELVHAQLVGNDAWSIAGYRAAERLLRAAAMPHEAARVHLSAAKYRTTFEDVLDRRGGSDIPPAWQEGGIDWGNLAVGWPCQVLPPGDPRIDRLAHRYWAAVGGAGTGYYRNPDSLHGYVAADLGTWALLAGERSMADSVLQSLLDWRSASGGVGEMFTRSGRDFGANYPPHPTSAAALIALVRNSIVFDDGDTLQLTLGPRDSWWRKGSRITAAPTRWGLLDLSFELKPGAAEWHWSGVPVWTELTLPASHRLAQPLPARWRRGSRPGVILVPPGTTRVRVAVAPEVGPAVAAR